MCAISPGVKLMETWEQSLNHEGILSPQEAEQESHGVV